MNRVVEPIRDVNVKQSQLNANYELIFATCKKSMFNGIHDMFLLDFVEITFTIVGNSCPLTRIASANAVPPKKTTSHSVETKKPELKVYNRKPKNVKNVGYPNYSLVYRLQIFKTYDREPLSAHDLYAKANIGIFVGYAPAKKAFIIYNKRTLKTIETNHVTFDELTTLASKQFSSGLRPHSLTPVTSTSGLVLNLVSQQPCIPPNRDAWDRLFQPMFDEYFNPLIIAVSLVPVVTTQRAIDLADSPVSTSIDQDAPSTSISSTQEQEQEHSPNVSQGFEESPKTPIFRNDPLHESLHEDLTS
uniref:Retroviral polymerase SH3-like domain-containing protein n=1 Tax=Tanacetum cinerariifolium TaxID=118510 RepID=A0A6L2LGF5_TANCI|nr:hypothetical protein [Tanacetum cinerariifolium]